MKERGPIPMQRATSDGRSHAAGSGSNVQHRLAQEESDKVKECAFHH